MGMNETDGMHFYKVICIFHTPVNKYYVNVTRNIVTQKLHLYFSGLNNSQVYLLLHVECMSTGRLFTGITDFPAYSPTNET